MATQTAPFSRFEWMIAWRYLRARRAEGGVSVMTWISLIGITLAVFALIATMSVRAGFRAEESTGKGTPFHRLRGLSCAASPAPLGPGSPPCGSGRVGRS